MLVAYYLKNTLFQYGSVNRGICQLSSKSTLESVAEYEEIASDDGLIYGECNRLSREKLLPNSLVSMNCWLFNSDIFESIEKQLMSAFKNEKDLTKESYLPTTVMLQIREKGKEVEVVTSSDEWFGLTYSADSEQVSLKIDSLLNEGLFALLNH